MKKNYQVLYFLCLLLFFACQKNEPLAPDVATLPPETEIDDANDLETEFLEAESRRATHRIQEITTAANNYIALDTENCYSKYEGYVKYPVDSFTVFTIKGEGFEDRRGRVEAWVLKDRQSSDILSWTDTAIVVQVKNTRNWYKNVLLKFRVVVDGEHRRKSVKCVSGLQMAVAGENGLTKLEGYYPSAVWNNIQMYNRFGRNNDYARVVIDNYRPTVGDMLQVGGRYAYVNFVSDSVDKEGFSRFAVYERNRNCRGRLAIHKYYYLKDGQIQARLGEEGQGLFEVLYRAQIQ